ncbi:MAG TPA: hypothetical protein VFZ66_24450 [Herpetosiphonaceae bacterium]
MTGSKTLSVALSSDERWDLAMFLKRVTWRELRSCAVDDAEAYRMREAIDKVQRGLEEIGVCVR